MKGLTNKFKNDPKLQMDYNNIASAQMKHIVTEEAPSHYIMGETQYLLHRPVVRSDKITTKLRMIYDADAKPKGSVRLNECLYAGRHR